MQIRFLGFTNSRVERNGNVALAILFGDPAEGIPIVGVGSIQVQLVHRLQEEFPSFLSLAHLGIDAAQGMQDAWFVLAHLRGFYGGLNIGVVDGTGEKRIPGQIVQIQLFRLPARDDLTTQRASQLEVSAALAGGH